MTYAAAIIATYDRASATQRVDGRAWYPSAGATITALADWSGLPADRLAAIVAALSPRNPWRWNVQDAAAIAYAAMHGLPCPTVSTFNVNRDRAWAFATGTSDWLGSAPKVRAFVANMTGDVDAVTVDVWAVRVATHGERVNIRSDADYRTIADAYRMAARMAGETPRDIQAITWLVGQADGLGSARHGRPDRSLKRGTLPIVVELLTGQLALRWAP